MSETNETHPRIKQMPTCPENHRESINEFLQYIRNRIELSLNDHRAELMHNKSPQLVGQVNHFRKYIQCINWLISLNDQRRKVNRATADRPE